MMLAASTFVALALSGAPAEGALPACSGPVIQSFEAGQHVAAARSAEACWQVSGDLRLLHFAAQARESAGHLSHAVRWYQQYLEGAPATATQRSRAEVRLQALMTRVVAVTIEAPAGRLRLVYAGRPDALELDWPGGEGVVYLEPGGWSLRSQDTSGDGQQFHVPSTRRVMVGGPDPMPSQAAPAVPVPVQVRVAPARAAARGGRLELQPDSGPSIVVPLQRASTQVSMAPGAWRLTLRAPGREVVEQQVRVRGPLRVDFAPRLDRTTRARIGLGTGLVAASLGLGAWGAVGVVAGRNRPTALFHDAEVFRVADAIQNYSLWVDGAAVLAAAGGTLGVAVTDATSWRRLPLVIETGVGAGLAVGGAIWRGAAKRALVEGSQAIEPSPDFTGYRSFLAERHPRETAASVMFGLGMAAAGGVSLITMLVLGRGPEPVRRLEPIGGPMHVGPRGRF